MTVPFRPDPLVPAAPDSTAAAPPASAPPVAPKAAPRKPVKPADSRQAYLMRQAARIMANGGSQADVLQYFQEVEGVKFSRPIQVVPAGGAGPNPGAGAIAPSDTGKTWGTPPLLQRFGQAESRLKADVAMKLVQGVTFGFGDEAIGSLIGLLSGEGASAGRDRYREELQQFESQSPKTALGAELAGGLALGGTKPMMALAAKGARMGAAGRTALIAGEGAAGGALAGAGNTPGPISERAKGAIVGFVAGGALTGAVAGGAKVVGAVTRPVAELATNWSQRLQQALPGLSPSRAGRSLVAQAVVQDVGSIDAAIAKAEKLARTGAPVTVADVAGENTLDLMRAAASVRGPQKQRVVDELMGRQGDQGARMVGSLFRSLRAGLENAYDASIEIMANRKAAADPKYAEAFAHDVPLAGKLRKLLSIKTFRDAYEAGRAIGLEEDMAGLSRGRPIPPLAEAQPAKASRLVDAAGKPLAPAAPAAGGAAAGSIVNETLPIRAIDYMKRGLDAVIERAGQEGRPTMDRQHAVALRRILNDALDEVGESAPIYREAREAWKGHTEMLDALSLGKGGTPLSRGGARTTPYHRKPPELVQRELASLKTEAEREMYRMGAAQDLADLVGGVSADGADIARRFFGGRTHAQIPRDMERRIRALFGSDDVAEQFMDYVTAEARMSYTAGKLGGSRTAPMLQSIREMESALPGKGGLLRQTVGAVLEPLTNRATTGWTQAASDEISNLATKGLRGSDELLAALHSLKALAQSHYPVLPVVAGARVGGSRELR